MLPAPARRWLASLLSICKLARFAVPHACKALDAGDVDAFARVVVVVEPFTFAPQLAGAQGLAPAGAADGGVVVC
jgi:hypothetical protein